MSSVNFPKALVNFSNNLVILYKNLICVLHLIGYVLSLGTCLDMFFQHMFESITMILGYT